ncbi:hypothetical protein V9T40_009494 [Parthenolecanium corni]|uniref:GH18 domain-containing protein n=1 Tax=Parthenolecanium corni TaxID=536013 RepID=A0AAN9TQ36_9HEMI
MEKGSAPQIPFECVTGVKRVKDESEVLEHSSELDRIGPRISDKAAYFPENIPGAPCTDIVYSFALLNDTSNSFEPADPYLAFDKNFYKRVTALSENGYRVILSAGGWNESKSKYSKMMADENLRYALAQQTANFIVENNFCGFDFDLEYPGAYQGEVDSRYADDKVNFVAFLWELRLAFNQKQEEFPDMCRLSLSIAVSANERIVDAGYDVPRIVEVCDWIGVMTYDFFVHSDGFTGFVSPFQSVPEITGPKKKFNVIDGMNLWLERGAPAEKLIVGFPAYGQAYLLDDANRHYYGAPATGKPTPGKYTASSGTLAFYEIIDNVNEMNYNVVHNPYLETYSYKGLDWVSYDDTLDAAIKAEYIKEICFRGAMFWSLDNECFQENCPGGSYPLIWTVHNILHGKKTVDDVRNIT